MWTIEPSISGRNCFQMGSTLCERLFAATVGTFVMPLTSEQAWLTLDDSTVQVGMCKSLVVRGILLPYLPAVFPRLIAATGPGP